jgi:CheY-like chemotaxis protein
LKKYKDVKDENSTKETAIKSTKPKKVVMLVDDSGVHLRMIKGILEEKYDIIMATSGLKAISLIHEKRPDLIVLDYEMPILDGRETMVKLRESEEAKNVPIVFVTAVNDREHIEAVLSLKPAGYILKPLDRERLLKTIYDVIGE